MNLNSLRVLLAAPFASLFLVLSLCAFVIQPPASTGFRIPMVRLHRNSQEGLVCDGRSEFVRLTKDGKIWINETELPMNQLRPTVTTLMENRAERVIYVVVDSDVSYGQFADLLDKVEGTTADLHILVISGENRRTLERGLDPCDYFYPEEGFVTPTAMP
jgi:biopolymer transport protein ExbD